VSKVANLSNRLIKTGKMNNQINDADVAELVDARDLKCLAHIETAQLSCKTRGDSLMETNGTKRDFQNICANARRAGERPPNTVYVGRHSMRGNLC
jgi:hypothetical protein